MKNMIWKERIEEEEFGRSRKSTAGRKKKNFMSKVQNIEKFPKSLMKKKKSISEGKTKGKQQKVKEGQTSKGRSK